jgi:hypothetical protein
MIAVGLRDYQLVNHATRGLVSSHAVLSQCAVGRVFRLAKSLAQMDYFLFSN